MSDSWYRDPPSIPPYEDFLGNLWTWDGACLNPIHTCEPPQWHRDLEWFSFQAEIAFAYRESLDEFHREHLGVWPDGP